MLTFFGKPSKFHLLCDVGEEVGHWIHYNIRPEIFDYHYAYSENQLKLLREAYAYIGKVAPYNKEALPYMNIANFIEYIGTISGILFASQR